MAGLSTDVPAEKESRLGTGALVGTWYASPDVAEVLFWFIRLVEMCSCLGG